MMGRVEDFFMHNFRDVSSRKSLRWGEVQKFENGNSSIRYKYEARIWDRETMIMNQIFTFDKEGNYVRYENTTGVQALVSGFFTRSNEDYADVTYIVFAEVIPIPAAVWLFGSALGLLGWLKRRPV